MRLWHKDFIAVLPRQQLLGQWRECCLIAKNIAEKGTPNHILVNKIMDYPITHFGEYSYLVFLEARSRGYRVDFTQFTKYNIGTPSIYFVPSYELFNNWHNDRYFWQCYYNLQEKHDCGGISFEEWLVIHRMATNTARLK